RGSGPSSGYPAPGEDPLRRAYAPTKLDGIVELFQGKLGGGDGGDDVEGVEEAAVTYAEDPAGHLALPAGDLYAMLAEDHAHELLAIDALGHPGRRNRRVEVLVGPEQLEPHPLDACPRSTPQHHVALEDVLDALLYKLLQRYVELDDEADGGRPRRLRRVLLVGLPGRRPVEVET